MKLDEIGFYTMSDERAMNASEKTRIKRMEICLTDKCNFKCVYCRGVPELVKGNINFHDTLNLLELLKPDAVRFTGGEPTLYDNNALMMLVYACSSFANYIALSTNGTAPLKFYKELISAGVNDFSISLDGACCAVGDTMSGGVIGAWDTVVSNIKILSELVYVSVGMVFTEQNVHQCKEAVLFADSLGVSDIRVIPASQYNKALIMLKDLPTNIRLSHNILNYRINNLKNGIQMRGIDTSIEPEYKCPLVLDDVMIAGKYHFPCPIYFRENGNPIGIISSELRNDRLKWFKETNCSNDVICRTNCLDVCHDYNKKWQEYHG